MVKKVSSASARPPAARPPSAPKAKAKPADAFAKGGSGAKLAPGAAKADASTNFVAAMKATPQNPLPKGAIPGFSVLKHVMPKKAADLKQEYFFGALLPTIDRYWTDRLVRGAAGALPELETAVADGKLELPGGITAARVTKAPKVEDYFPQKPPLIELRRGERALYLSPGGDFSTAASLVEKGQLVGSFELMDFSALSGLAGHPKVALDMKFLNGRASPRAAAELARIVDLAFRGGKGQELIDGAEQKALAMKGEALARYFEATGAKERIAAAVKDVKTRGPAEGLGDYDMSISVASKMKNGDKVVLKDAGELLIFDNHASGATLGVELAALKEGRLKVYGAYGGELSILELGAKQAQDLSGLAYASTLAFDLEFWVGELLAREG